MPLQQRQCRMPRHHGDEGAPGATLRVELVSPLEKIEHNVLAVIVAITGGIPDLPRQTSCTAVGCAHGNGECRLVLQWTGYGVVMHSASRRWRCCERPEENTAAPGKARRNGE